jgi:hypothetical protein
LGRKEEGSFQCRKHIRHTRRNTGAAYRAGKLGAPDFNSWRSSLAVFTYRGSSTEAAGLTSRMPPVVR